MEINDPRVPPGFRFHPTEEELVGYYLKRKINSLKIDLDVIVELDLYRMEPWDFQADRCKLGYEEQNEWYFFSHKDKKYPTGTRTNRATAAGFWKATGRDKAVLTKDNIMIGMRKTLVFYKGRAPNGRKTDWIMHEYRLQTTQDAPPHEEGWVVCRAFRKPTPAATRPYYGYDFPNRSNQYSNMYPTDGVNNNNNNNMMMIRRPGGNDCPSPIPDLASPSSSSLSTLDANPGASSAAGSMYHHHSQDFIPHQYYQQQEQQQQLMMIPSNNNIDTNFIATPSNHQLHLSADIPSLIPTSSLVRNVNYNDGDDCKGSSSVNWKFLDSLLASSDNNNTNNLTAAPEPPMLLSDYTHDLSTTTSHSNNIDVDAYSCDHLIGDEIDQNDDQLGQYLSCFPNF